MTLTSPRILITGGAGFVGGSLALVASRRCQTYVGCHKRPFRDTACCCPVALDITDAENVRSVIADIMPSVVIHTAAVAGFDACARNPEIAREVNVVGTHNITKAARATGARLVYLSTDLVHDGIKGQYSERDVANPICHYGRTKLEGEEIVFSQSPDYCIARTSLVYGYGEGESKCFTESIIDALRSGRTTQLFTDEYRSPIFLDNLCHVLLELALRTDLQGAFNTCGPDRLSRYSLGVKLAKAFGLPDDLLIPITVDEFSFADKRPKDCSMVNANARRVLETEFWSVDEGLRRMAEMRPHT